MTGTDWVAWHRQYDAEGPLSRRLESVRGHISRVLEAGPSPVTVLSLCSGDGRDVVGAAAQASGDIEIRGRLVELDPTLAAAARERIATAGVAGVEVLEGDAGLASSFAGAVPANLVLLCGIFGNVADGDIERTIAAMPSLCAEGARVIWTRHRRAPDLTPTIRRWFEEAGFEHEAFDAIDDSSGSVGVERFADTPRPFDPALRLFRFEARPR